MRAQQGARRPSSPRRAPSPTRSGSRPLSAGRTAGAPSASRQSPSTVATMVQSKTLVKDGSGDRGRGAGATKPRAGGGPAPLMAHPSRGALIESAYKSKPSAPVKKSSAPRPSVAKAPMEDEPFVPEEEEEGTTTQAWTEQASNLSAVDRRNVWEATLR